jgi:1-phosphatidylinositol-4-phosphate 5-kinase
MKKGSEKDIQFTVMASILDSPLSIHEQYDLKGSTVGRHVETDGSNPDVALKDLDFKRRIKLGPKLKAQLLEQIENDTKFLEKLGICDYSLLIGYHFLTDTEREYISDFQPR